MVTRETRKTKSLGINQIVKMHENRTNHRLAPSFFPLVERKSTTKIRSRKKRLQNVKRETIQGVWTNEMCATPRKAARVSKERKGSELY